MRERSSRVMRIVAVLFLLLPMVLACRSTKHVPDGSLLLDDVDIHITDPRPDVQTADLVNYLRQTENHKVLGGMKLQLAVYNISGHDSTMWFNRWIQRVGTPPVIYDSTLTSAGANQLRTALKNRGYMHNEVTYDVRTDSARKKARVDYNITLGNPYYISSIDYNIDDDSIRNIILADSANFGIKVGSLLDRTKLDVWRQSITDNLRNHGYYAFNKDYITFTADTAADSHAVDITLNTMPPYKMERMPYYTSHRPFYVRSVTYVTDYDPVKMQESYFGKDTISCGTITVFDAEDNYINSKLLEECNFIEPGKIYDASAVDKTYKALGRLSILKFINIDVRPIGEVDGKIWLDAYVLLSRDRAQSFSVSLEGTNSEGDLGFGIGLDYQHRNLMKGSETFNAKFRMSYESLSGKFDGLINNNYSEYAGEVGLKYPKFKFPFLSHDFKRKIQASTELAASFNYQERPEYTRILVGGAWRYLLLAKQQQERHTFNLMDFTYVYLPKSRSNFLDSIYNPLLRYSYEDHFIMRMGYNYYRTNKRQNSLLDTRLQRDVYTLRANAETAGNFLYAMSNILGAKREAEDSYKLFGIRYSQYFKIDADYAYTHIIDSRNSVAFHVGAGAAVPYGNSTVIPFEKRFYAGGANSVRGWGVRNLGPGSFSAPNSMNSFIYQCGDIRFDANVEYRAKLFWIIELGAFIDAGNIWTIREYEDQPGGVFKFDKFYEQIAVAYGLGIRLDFTYFLLRFDLGMKAHDPATGAERWPVFHPKFDRDAQLHFSVGYPF